MSDESKKLENLRVVDLRNELTKRNLEKNGVKTELMERLSKALISEGHDPDTYIFDLESEKKSHSRRRRSIAESDGGDVKMDDEENNDGPNDEENDDSMTESSFCDKEDSYNTVHQAQTENNDDNRDIDVSSNVQNGNKSPELWSQNTSDEGVADKKNGLTDEVVEVPKEQRVKVIPQKTESSVDSPEQNRGADANDEKISSDGYAADYSVEDQSSNSQINVKQDGKELELTTKEEDDATISLTIGEDEVKQLSAESDEKLESEKKEEDAAAPQIVEAKRINKTVASSETKKSENAAEARTEGKKSLSAIAKSSRSLWISGLSSKTRATDLKQLFSKYGKVVSAKIVTNAKTPGARCYGYVCMLSSEEAAACISHFHLTELHGRVITVEKGKDDATGPIRLSDSKHAAETKTANAAARSTEKHAAVEAKKAAEAKVLEKKTADDKSIEKKSDKDKDKDKHKENEKEKEKPLVHKETEKSESKSSGEKNKKTSSLHGSTSEQTHRSKSKSVKASESGKPVVKNVVPLDLIKKEREKIRMKERERIYREEQRRRQIERERMRQFEQRQREETLQLAKERMKLKLEREKIEQEKLELLRIERENQRLERERLQREKEDLRRTQMKLEETRRAVKRSLEMKEYEEERKRRASAERRHMHMPPSPPPPSSKKESSSRGGHGGSSMEYISRRVYETSSNSRGESSRKDHSRTETNKDQSSRYGISRVVDNSRNKAADVSHKSYSDMSRKSGDSSRYDRSGGESDAWRSSNIPVSSYSNNSASVPWSNSGSSDLRKTDNIAPWVRPNMNTSDRWPNSSSGVAVGRSGGIPMGNTGNPVFRTGYSNPMSAMDMGMCGGPYERYDSSYKQQNIVRKY